jgi:hypothetical protein
MSERGNRPENRTTGSDRRDIQRADPAARRHALVAAGLIAAVGWAAYFVLQDWLSQLRGSNEAELRHSLEGAMIWGSWAATLPVAILAVWLWRFGGRVGRAERYPPPETKVIRDTPVVHGHSARLLGVAMRVLAAFLGLLSAGTLIAVHRLVARLEG